jgi:hypothetical protein
MQTLLVNLEDTALAFIAGAFDALRREFVVPTPVFHPYLRVGRDYFGDTIHEVPGYAALEKQLEELCPERFAVAPRPGIEFASSYIFSLLEAAIAACGRLGYRDRQDHFDATNEAVTTVIRELIAVLEEPTYEVVCCRFVTHLATEDDAEIAMGQITVVPEPSGFGGLNRRLAHEIAGGWSAFNRDDPRPFDRPHALLVVRARTDDPEPYEVAQRLSSQLERFLLLVRLLNAGTAYSVFEVTGTTTMVSRMHPGMTEFNSSRALVRRTVWLGERHARAFDAVSDLLDQADVKREGMVTTSFDVALRKFNSSHQSPQSVRDPRRPGHRT